MQYIPRLAELGIQVDEYIARFGSWPPAQKIIRPLWFAATVLQRVESIVASHHYDITLLQRELVSTFVTLEPFTRRPRVLDVDDAVWLSHKRAENSFVRLARMCDGIMCGNDFIAETVAQWNDNLIVLPTAVDTARFSPGDSRPAGRRIIGWSGLNAGAHFLLQIEPALDELLRSRRDTVLRVVSDAIPNFRRLDPQSVEFVRWSPDNEVGTIQEMSAGLMPIDDTLWSRGKCSYKMLLYMSCAVPVVVSPYGMNAEVLRRGEIGFGATKQSEWIEAISWLLDNQSAAREMGLNGRRVVEEHYSLDALSVRMAGFLKTFT